MPDRYTDFRRIAAELGTDAVALVPGANFTRLYGHVFMSNERPLVVVIPVEGDPAAIVPNLELSSFAALDFEGEVFDWRDQTGYDEAFAALAARLPLRSVAVEGQSMRVFIELALRNAWPGLGIVDGEARITGLRYRKTPDEIAAMERAIAISEAALGETLDQVRIGQTEKHVERILIQALFAHGAEEQAFGALVAAGAHSAASHAHARDDYALRAGDPLLIDFGARWGGLCADITRTAFVGHVTDEAASVYETVLAANRRGHEIAAPGVTAHEVDDAVISVLEASPYADRIRTKTGHGLGRDVHEAPYVMRGNHQRLEPGVVFTNEPGLYQTGGFGIRIEDDVLITDSGNRSLTTFPRDIRIVG
ncbi:M24 family metallopeptidase [Paracoccus saliphilus]|uniref:Aminopeptidase P family protein n=1 Tax=Paracoccus saliphilus TaxID=405559 RepID=A0AA45W3I3_9RHOB|nr:Xaa-Pro peptidase family protein [Paracoccus saliphilus]WCR02525.1 aminopeptidase P family protein [Paracoccus saliphilus]SIS76900.1 Xaa-Pro aminopeptidase [Paracoccus saliphilus]